MIYDHNGNYVPGPAPVRRDVKFIGELPPGGTWVLHAIPTGGVKWAILATNTLGVHEPRIVKDGVMTVLKPYTDLPDTTEDHT